MQNVSADAVHTLQTCRFFEALLIDELAVYITIAPLSDPQRSSSSMLRLATATGLTSLIDLDDVCIRMRPFHLQNRCLSPADVLQKLLTDFNEQVLSLMLLACKPRICSCVLDEMATMLCLGPASSTMRS